ncbi:general stress protein [Nakamurella endophytica]|uniref:General stress protein 17M-like domain-containing protein n=1 Tax=Nakamurella endophytica TaxID=1748367 RepID=A0A917T559_9ACTN|nr:general stress protein [Nakamurella endophytica]GGM10555.1 hypothetical protein GCM10011594_33070 [Nakamurella endophytica]
MSTTTYPSADTVLDLQYPMPVATYGSYTQAQRAVDYLAERQFPVANVQIVGTDLRSVERVTGRLTRARFTLAGALSGLWMGLFVTLAFVLLTGHLSWALVAVTPLIGALFGLLWSALGYSAVSRNGARDFTSRTELRATSYQILVEHSLAAQAHALLSELTPPATAR